GGMAKGLQGGVDCREVQATLRFEKDGNLADQELVELYRLAPLNQAVRRLAARACAQRGDAADALMHLAVLQRLGNIKPGDRQLAAALGGVRRPGHPTTWAKAEENGGREGHPAPAPPPPAGR